MDFNLSTLFDLWDQLAMWQPHRMMVIAIVVVSLASALLTSRVIGGIGYVTVPIGFAIMYVFGYVTTFLTKDIHLPLLDDFQRGVMFSICGHIVGGLLMLMIFKVKEDYVRRA
jgi:hypothetical protein